MKRFIGVFSLLAILFLIFYSFFRRIFIKNRNSKIIFGSTPIINNKYWANALKQIHIDSETLMEGYYSINRKEDFDKYFDDIIPKFLNIKPINKIAHLFFVWLYIIHNARVFVMPFDGVIFKKFLWKFELILFKFNRIKTVVLPYGADSYMYSKIKDKSLQNALLISYPNAARKEKEIEKKVFFWSKYADVVITGVMSEDGFPRWDVCIPQFIVIDISEWTPIKDYSMNDGISGTVRVLHAPNHRGFKGTEFLIKALEDLKSEGIKVELILLEKVPNELVKKTMQEVDILAEQFIFTGYALNAIEGMASGLPVLSNLEHDWLTLYRRYSFFNECPIVSTTPETLKDNLRILITNPQLRAELGKLGRKYVEKYHSYKTFQYLFTNILKKLDGEDVDLMNLFHPVKSEYVKTNYIKTPLINNKLPKI